uniref:Gelsolin-like domain-containing protein n=1 Tax=Bursaphelenchus xylophilus TaxID=6326 RepID=A0A1I7RTT7_BURXY
MDPTVEVILGRPAVEDSTDESYGEFILLGYNGPPDSASLRCSTNGRKHRSKMTFRVREQANGIKKAGISETKQNPLQNDAVKDSSKHVVSYLYYKGHAVLVEYEIDQAKDMFQIGRSSEPQIDFTIVDTWLAASSPGSVLSPLGHHRSQKVKSVNAKGEKQVSSTISRYACRILADREEPNKCYVYAAGFDTSRNIFLGEKATKWQKKNGEFDGLTTNGVLILHPNRSADTENQEMYIWREVSVDGEIYTLRETRSSTKRGDLVPDETNQLQDGTLIDLCGATLLWRSAEGLKQSPSTAELERRLDELNAGESLKIFLDV